MKKLLILSLMISVSFSTHAKVIDKIAGVINDKVFTLSEVKRVQKTIGIRKEIAPFIYSEKKYTPNSVLLSLQNGFIVRDKLEELGFVVSDDAVEDRIAATQKQLGLSRNQLENFIGQKGLTFNEYHELIRSAMEYNIFNRRIIAPLVTITDQELRNKYYSDNKNAPASSNVYEVVDFSLPQNVVLKEDIKKLPLILAEYKKTGNLPEIYSDLSTDDIGRVSDEDVPKELSNLFRQTQKGEFSKAYVRDGTIHSYFIAKKEIRDSSAFLKNKRSIYQDLFMVQADNLSKNWFSRESLSYYILNNL